MLSPITSLVISEDCQLRIASHVIPQNPRFWRIPDFGGHQILGTNAWALIKNFSICFLRVDVYAFLNKILKQSLVLFNDLENEKNLEQNLKNDWGANIQTKKFFPYTDKLVSSFFLFVFLKFVVIVSKNKSEWEGYQT